jgi:hypothetical protein
MCNVSHQKLPDQCYLSDFQHWCVRPLLYQPFECGSVCDLVKGFIGMDMDLAKTEQKEKKKFNQSFLQDPGNNPTFWKINNDWRIGLGFPFQPIERDSPSV